MDQVKSEDITTSHVEGSRKGGGKMGGASYEDRDSVLKVAVLSCAANLYGTRISRDCPLE